MATTAILNPIVDLAAFELDFTEMDISAYSMPQDSIIPGETDLPATERAHTAAVMDTDKSL